MAKENIILEEEEGKNFYLYFPIFTPTHIHIAAVIHFYQILISLLYAWQYRLRWLQ